MDNEVNKKVYDFIKGNIINFIVILTSFAYIFYQMVQIKRTELTLWEAIAKIGIGAIVGLMIKQGIGENGFNKGYRSKIWQNNIDKYNANCNMANPYIERTDNFYASEEIEKRRTYRRSNLMNARMRYEWFFDKDGNYIDDKIVAKWRITKRNKAHYEGYHILDKRQRKVLKKCIKVKIYNLNLFSEYSNELENETHREKTDKTQRSKMFRKNSVSQIFIAVFGAYFVAMWDGWDLGMFITATIQVCSWVFCGVTQLYTNYNYVVIEKVNKIKRKTELIVKFVRGCENGLYVKNPYELKEVDVDDKERVSDKIVSIPIGSVDYSDNLHNNQV